MDILAKYKITQEEADNLATAGKGYFLVTFGGLYQFLWSNAQGRAMVVPLVIQCKGLCGRGKYAIMTAKELNAAAGYDIAFED